MENNNFNNQQPNYQQPNYQQPYGGQQYQQPYGQAYQPAYQQVDPNYEQTASEFLKSAIISCVLAGFPIANIVAIFKAKANRKKILEYIDQGGMHTPKIKTSSCLSRAAIYGAIGSIVIYGFYALYIGFMFFIMIMAAIGSNY